MAVLGISLALTVGAAGYLALGTNSGGADADTHRFSRTFYAAESGLRLGIRWCKAYPDNKFNDPAMMAWADNLVLTQSSTIPRTEGWADWDGIQVKVVFKQGALGGGYHELDSYATAGPGMDTVKLSLQITGANPSGSGSSFPTGTLKTWVETLYPGR